MMQNWIHVISHSLNEATIMNSRLIEKFEKKSSKMCGMGIIIESRGSGNESKISEKKEGRVNKPF